MPEIFCLYIAIISLTKELPSVIRHYGPERSRSGQYFLGMQFCKERKTILKVIHGDKINVDSDRNMLSLLYGGVRVRSITTGLI